MQVQVDIPFEQILKIVRTLPEAKKEQLRDELNKKEDMETLSGNLRALLMNGPVATEKQLEVIENNRNAINRWREK